jgi:GNAT superfamily N-acetyltransferase
MYYLSSPSAPSIVLSMVLTRHFDEHGDLTNGGRRETLLETVASGIFLFPVVSRCGLAGYGRAQKHDGAGKALHKAFSVENGRHWRLDFVATSPAHQGQGCAARLLRRVCEDADEAGAIVYLSSSDGDNQRYYER